MHRQIYKTWNTSQYYAIYDGTKQLTIKRPQGTQSKQCMVPEYCICDVSCHAFSTHNMARIFDGGLFPVALTHGQEPYADGSVQYCSNSIADAQGLLQSYAEPSIQAPWYRLPTICTKPHLCNDLYTQNRSHYGLGPLSLTEISRYITGKSNYIHVERLDVFTQSCPNFNGGLVTRRLEVGACTNNFIPDDISILVQGMAQYGLIWLHKLTRNNLYDALWRPYIHVSWLTFILNSLPPWQISSIIKPPIWIHFTLQIRYVFSVPSFIHVLWIELYAKWGLSKATLLFRPITIHYLILWWPRSVKLWHHIPSLWIANFYSTIN